MLLKTFFKQEANFYAVFKWTKRPSQCMFRFHFRSENFLTLCHLPCASPGAWHMGLNNYLITDRFSLKKKL